MKTSIRLVPILAAVLLIAAAALPVPRQAGDDPNPPDQTVKLIFIHHSTGENWLKDEYGDLGQILDRNNYFVSDTNYGWGPDAIGDRTDIPDWPEWFASGNTPAYMDALFNENGQNASYTRTLSDPGGENTIILFKSCFPNSALEGNPEDPPDPDGWLSVGHAKYVYNQILPYFATRPDKMFVVITAPPLVDGTHADNARAFNQWLVNDWLQENQYAGGNVFVFDFYNILTGPDAHHRYQDGQVEHIAGSRNTSYYPSEDDHPSVQGSRKATEEFVPLLNVFYHRWQAGAPQQTPPEAAPTTGQDLQPATSPASGAIEDFDGDRIPGSEWVGYWDEATSSSVTCEVQPGTAHSDRALHFAFNIAANSWGTCATTFDALQDWSSGSGLIFYYRAAQPGLIFDVNLFWGPAEDRATYIYTIESVPESVEEWVPVQLRWEDFHRVSWEEDAGVVFADSGQVQGLAFGASTPPDAPNRGEVWIDGLKFIKAGGEQKPQAPASPAAEPTRPEATTEAQPEGGRSSPCAGGLILPLLVIGLTGIKKCRR